MLKILPALFALLFLVAGCDDPGTEDTIEDTPPSGEGTPPADVERQPDEPAGSTGI